MKYLYVATLAALMSVSSINAANANLYNKEGLPSSLFSTLDSE